MLLLLGVLSFSFACSCYGSQWNHLHNPLPADSGLLMPVRLGDGHLREKREAVEMTQPFRILPVYHENFDQNLLETASLIREEIIPKLLSFLRESLMVAPLPGPILINNNCPSGNVMRDVSTGEVVCGDECGPTVCGAFPVPTEHLKQCIQCGGSNNCVAGTPARDGPGVTNFDYILYITAESAICPPPSPDGTTQTIAIAGPCQLEVQQDRPIAGHMNFCPNGVRGATADSAFIIAKHEIMHAIGFLGLLFSFWRDPTNNQPRTPRNPSTGFPFLTPQGFEISSSTVQQVTYPDWLTTSGRINHTVSRLVTPAVKRVAQDHFNCSTLAGVELENQGGPTTMISHWEKRVLGNEAMTGIITFNAVFSRFTFAALEDSGWYNVNYSLADELIWGRNAGCRFAEESCGEWIAAQRSNDQSLSPFCDVPQASPVVTSCTVDREAISQCNLVTTLPPLPAEYQYFQTPETGGPIELADFCPFQDLILFDVNATRFFGSCFFSSNAPSSNDLLEAYGPESRCINHGRQWTVDSVPVDVYGGGCYQYSCSEDSVTITIGTEDFLCSCSAAGQELLVNLTVSNQRYEGSILCPPCTQICHVRSRNFIIADSTTTTGAGEDTNVTTTMPQDEDGTNHASSMTGMQLLLLVLTFFSWAL